MGILLPSNNDENQMETSLEHEMDMGMIYGFIRLGFPALRGPLGVPITSTILVY